jgi:hypothetical protein
MLDKNVRAPSGDIDFKDIYLWTDERISAAMDGCSLASPRDRRDGAYLDWLRVEYLLRQMRDEYEQKVNGLILTLVGE